MTKQAIGKRDEMRQHFLRPDDCHFYNLYLFLQQLMAPGGIKMLTVGNEKGLRAANKGVMYARVAQISAKMKMKYRVLRNLHRADRFLHI